MAKKDKGAWTESRLQIKIVSTILRLLQDEGRMWYFAVPNGRLRSTTEAIRMKKEGVIPGVPDITIIDADGLYYGLELKIKSGRVSAAQTRLHNFFDLVGFKYAVCYDAIQVAAALEEWGFLSDDCKRFPDELLPEDF